jgi:glutamate racemase
MTKSIALFDSGLGGLTVLRELASNFPNESFVYLGDIARLPYGNKSPETIKKYGLQILQFLQQQNVKALIIACNSASTVFLGERSFQGIPLLNVIEPGSEAAIAQSKDEKIGVLGTSATIRSHAYLKTLTKLNSRVQVFEQACPLLVPLVEEGVIDDPITQAVLERYLAEMKLENISTIILGCTHYPVLRPDLTKVLGEKVKLIESGQVLTQKLIHLFDSGEVSLAKESDRTIRICITDVTDHFERLAKQLMGRINFSLEKVVL